MREGGCRTRQMGRGSIPDCIFCANAEWSEGIKDTRTEVTEINDQ